MVILGDAAGKEWIERCIPEKAAFLSFLVAALLLYIVSGTGGVWRRTGLYLIPAAAGILGKEQAAAAVAKDARQLEYVTKPA